MTAQTHFIIKTKWGGRAPVVFSSVPAAVDRNLSNHQIRRQKRIEFNTIDMNKEYLIIIINKNVLCACPGLGNNNKTAHSTKGHEGTTVSFERIVIIAHRHSWSLLQSVHCSFLRNLLQKFHLSTAKLFPNFKTFQFLLSLVYAVDGKKDAKEEENPLTTP